jgi:hypothetical protein
MARCIKIVNSFTTSNINRVNRLPDGTLLTDHQYGTGPEIAHEYGELFLMAVDEELVMTECLKSSDELSGVIYDMLNS